MRDQILAAATRLFAAKGFDGTALQDIADAVGVRKASLLYHFPSKDDLRHAVLEQLLAHWNDVLPRVFLAASTGLDQFEGVVSEMVAFFVSAPDRAKLLTREMLDRPVQMAELVDRHVRQWVNVVCNHIRKGQQQGRLLADVDPEAYVHHFIVMLVAGVASATSLGGAPGERHLRELLRMARTSLFRPQPPTEP
jgi:TetR/AcrR family transcriptional regulator